jgi:hypothetical protein
MMMMMKSEHAGWRISATWPPVAAVSDALEWTTEESEERERGREREREKREKREKRGRENEANGSS